MTSFDRKDMATASEERGRGLLEPSLYIGTSEDGVGANVMSPVSARSEDVKDVGSFTTNLSGDFEFLDFGPGYDHSDATMLDSLQERANT